MKAYLFDMDGTLVNTIESISYFANNALKNHGLKTIPTDRYKILVGDGASVLVKRMLKEIGADEKFYDSVYKEYNETYDNDFLYLTKPYDKITELLSELKSRGCKTAIISNKPHITAQKVCDELFGSSLIDICFGKKDNFPVKPDPASTNEVIRQLGVEKSDCIYIGDTITDMKTGKNANLFTVGVLWGFRDLEEIKSGNPDAIIKNPLELLDINF